MRLERITYNKIKIFLTTDDLSERGLTKEDIWKDSLKWHQLFHEMLEEASEEFGVDIHGTVAVEIFTMHAQGMIMIITMDEQEEDLPFVDSFYELQSESNGTFEVLHEFNHFEDVIQASHSLAQIPYIEGSVYQFEDKYYYYTENLTEAEVDRVSLILSEYSTLSLKSIHRIQEYGKTIIASKAVQTLVHYFK